MADDNDYRRGRHCVFALHAHLVFVTKYRRRVFTAAILKDMQIVFEKVCTDFETHLVEFDGEDDHVHLLVHYPPKVALSVLVNSLKGVSSRRLRQMHPTLTRRYWRGVLWSPSYFAASCGGAPLSIIRQYIEQQRTPD
ncbi:IS200/IS605 family transposase [Gluconacetobacter entanii]|uniref:IS200/IS605 family transposase n=1 Tax=Gluconacetobacter entanii TaxID=108528 RepID=A0A318Q3P6_9PROT|nr:IS200/IS605 family transposase [Gluconacetobacter entanii]PYD63563.1 IS200/IS605 family transposase [Gluconacetobacter entanii]